MNHSLKRLLTYSALLKVCVAADENSQKGQQISEPLKEMNAQDVGGLANAG